mmetsp:Transcript_42217/g.49053  ORF Transcript_42217/g.49053 Transcript_42217/m.49053 type:complete len:258 (+) Transcript_42217:52-825(+)
MPDPDLKTCLSKIGSIPGSSVSPMSSTSTGLPMLTALPSVRKKFGVVNLSSIRPSFLPMFWSHFLPCSSGSIMSGQRCAWVARMAFSIETWSVGSDAMFQPLIVTGSPMTLMRSNRSATGMPFCLTCSSHWVTSFSRNSPVKAPKYEMQAADKKTLPTSSSISRSMEVTVSFHLMPSSSSSTTSFSALFMRFSQRSMSSSSWRFSSSIDRQAASRAATLSVTSLSSASLTASASLADLSTALTSSYLACFGATFLRT